MKKETENKNEKATPSQVGLGCLIIIIGIVVGIGVIGSYLNSDAEENIDPLAKYETKEYHDNGKTMVIDERYKEGGELAVRKLYKLIGGKYELKEYYNYGDKGRLKSKMEYHDNGAISAYKQFNPDGSVYSLSKYDKEGRLKLSRDF